VGRTHVLERTQLVALPREAVWAFFAEPRNLEAITTWRRPLVVATTTAAR
jgi:ligand-binding SRPBCC domain-containing protein